VIPISVVIPTQNRAELLEQTLESVATQSLRPAEVVVADDGSVDATPEVVSRYGATHVRNPRGDWGAGAARNAALARVRTEYVAFVDSDDLLLPDCLALLHEALARTPASVLAYGRALIARREHGAWVPCGLIAATATEVQGTPGALYARNSVPSSGALARTAAVRAVGGYAPGARFSEDHQLWIRLAQRHAPVYVPEMVSVYRLHAGNRHSPVMAARDEAEITRMADGDPRLARYRARRVGVQLCERMAEAVAARRPDEVVAVAWTLLVRQPERRAVLRSATRHWRARRRAHRDGLALWASRPDLRRWIGEFA
jgi:glycosyltransferase involved in cell wall biosynthesis